MTDERPRILRPDEIEAIAEKAAASAILTTLTSLGINTADVTQAQADMIFLRKLRGSIEGAATKIGMTILGMLVALIVGAAGAGLVLLLRGPSTPAGH